MLGWLLQAMLQWDGWTAKHLVGIYVLDQEWNVPDHLPASFVINTDLKDGPGKHWVAVFINSDGTVDYFDSYGTAPLERIYQRILSLGHDAIRFNTRMLQGPGSRLCGLYCVYFLRMRSYGISMQVITNPFREYDFAYNETLIRNFVKALWGSLIYMCWYVLGTHIWTDVGPEGRIYGTAQNL